MLIQQTQVHTHYVRMYIHKYIYFFKIIFFNCIMILSSDDDKMMSAIIKHLDSESP